jgi:predicted histone-like DNA-binding protein
MPLFFNRVLRGKPGAPANEKKWYLVLKSVGLVRTGNIARLTADETTLNAKEAELALVQSGKIAGRLLADGHTVEIEGWGRFHITANSSPSATPEEVNARNVKGLNIRFAPCRELQDAVNAAHLMAADSL